MKKLHVLIHSILLMGLCTNLIFSQNEVPANVKEFAQQALQTNSKLVGKSNYATLGFRNLDEINKAELGKPYAVYFVRLDNLKAFGIEKNTTKLVQNANKYWFPIEVNGSVRLKLEVLESKGKLISGDFGASRSAQMVANIDGNLKSALLSKGVSEDTRKSLVQIPSVNTLLFMVDASSNTYFVPVYSDADSIEIGKAYDAVDLFSILSTYSQKVENDIVH